MFFSFYSKFCLVKSKNEVHICNLHSKTQLLMYDKWGYSTNKNYLQKVDGGQSGSQDSRKTMDLSGKTYISHISDPKGMVRGLYKYQFLHHSYLEHPKMLFSRFPYFDNEAVISKSKELFTFLCENLPNSSKFLSGWRAIRFCAGFLSLGPCPGEGSGS